ncbi:MAG TPA: hypothetical protein VK937_15700, partial [Candidatus Limnocylindria bacterium]|nr:hypothetical protein [Candidatus Limnocylindria bacterium]
ENRSTKSADGRMATEAARLERKESTGRIKRKNRKTCLTHTGLLMEGISNNVGPVKHFLSALLSFHLKEFFSFVFFLVCSSLRRRPRLACNLSVGFSPT